MDYANKPTAFMLGKKKPDAPEMKPMTKEELEQCYRDVQKYLPKRNRKKN